MISTSQRRRGTAFAALSIAAAAVLAPVTAGSVAAAPAAAPPAASAASRSFSCTGIISRVYTRQTVTGTLTGLKPTNASVQNYVGTVVHTKAVPGKTNGWWGGYWKTDYALNQWNLGRAADGTVYHLMLPDTRMGGTFQGLLVSEFGGGAQGNWQNWMDCTTS